MVILYVIWSDIAISHFMSLPSIRLDSEEETKTRNSISTHLKCCYSYLLTSDLRVYDFVGLYVFTNYLNATLFLLSSN
jgi:hypothetical protein